MNRRDLVNAIAAHTGQEPRAVDATLKGFTEVVTAVVSKGEPVAITGFAKFYKRESPARMGRNPATGEAIRIKAKKAAKITPLKAFKDSVMTPSGAPKLAKGVWPPEPKATVKKAATKATAKKAGAAKTTKAAKSTKKAAGARKR